MEWMSEFVRLWTLEWPEKLNSWKSRGSRAPVSHSWRRQCCSRLVTVRELVYLTHLQNIDIVSISRYLVNIVAIWSYRNWNPDIESSLLRMMRSVYVTKDSVTAQKNLMHRKFTYWFLSTHKLFSLFLRNDMAELYEFLLLDFWIFKIKCWPILWNRLNLLEQKEQKMQD